MASVPSHKFAAFQRGASHIHPCGVAAARQSLLYLRIGILHWRMRGAAGRPLWIEAPSVRTIQGFPGRQTGFTLLEVLVALTIVAVALGAIIRATGQSTGNLVYVRDKIVASWVAENRIAEAILAEEWPPLGTQSGSEEMMGQDWNWDVTVSVTADPDLRRLDVSVSHVDATGSPLVTLSAFRGKGGES